MNAQSTGDVSVRWKSLSGVGLALLLLYGLINFGAAIGVPMTLEAKGGQGIGSPGVIMSRDAEEHMLGTTYERLHTENPKLDKLLVDSMVGMCSMMMSMAVAVLGIAWFSARRGARWAPWVLLVSGVIWVPYYFVIASDFGAFGAKDTFMAAVMVSLFAIPAVVGAILMLVAPQATADHP